MAYHGPSYGLSRECAMKAASKFSVENARRVLEWISEVTNHDIEDCSTVETPEQFAEHLKNGQLLCELINVLQPGSVKKINTMKMPFKERENIEMFLRGCESYGLKSQDLFQVNDLYENKNVYMVVDNIFQLGGQAQKVGFSGPPLGVRIASENKRSFDEDTIRKGQSVIGLQYGSNKGASQAGMTPYGANRQILGSGPNAPATNNSKSRD